MTTADTGGNGAGIEPAADEHARLREALADANIPTLLMVLVHLTGDRRWLSERYRPVRARGLDDNDSAGLPPEVQDEVRAAVFRAVVANRAGLLAPRPLEPDEVAGMLTVALADEVPDAYGPLLCEELGLASRDVEIPVESMPTGFTVLIIGAGISGLCAAIKLQAAGVPYQIIEKNDSVGGTWLENTYPGCGVDTPSHLYSFSFAMNTAWSRYFARREQVSAYLERLADEYDVRPSVRFGTEVERADYDPATATWLVQTRDTAGRRQTVRATVLISAVGQVNRPLVPPIEGLEEFDGPVMHTAQWHHDVSLRGKTVAVIGNGASAMQLVPSIADEAGRVVVFQRSKQWALPHPNYQRAVSDHVRYLMDEVPFYARWYRLRAFWNFGDRLHSSFQIDPTWEHRGRSINATNDSHRRFLTNYVKSELGDRQDLLDACLPDYPPYGKRPLIDNGWYRTIRRDDVQLVTERVTEVRRHSVVAASGEEFEADVIALATGFKILQFLWPMEIRGRSGQTLREMWGVDDARAHLGITVPDFPNFFILNGPNTFAGHGGSAILATEFQTRYVMTTIAELIRTGADAVEVRDEVFKAYNDELDSALSRTIWSHPGMTTYFRNDAGRIVVSSPWTYLDYWNRTREVDVDQYHFERLDDETADRQTVA